MPGIIDLKKVILFLPWVIAVTCISIDTLAQYGWRICNSPVFKSRVDDVFMVNAQTGYAVSGDGQIVKTTNVGLDWIMLVQDTTAYCRSVEFINTQKGFVGGFSLFNSTKNILRRTNDGGATWIDLTMQLHPSARKGICGLSVADSNTIYGCGNWFQDSAYIIKSIDGGSTWSFIDMHSYAASLIDMYFLNKDTGFVTGRGPLPLQTAVILYTTDGGQSWTYKFKNTITHEYCWKIQRLTNRVYFASIEDFGNSPRVLKSIDGGMSWVVKIVSSLPVSLNDSGIEGIGFVNPLKGWTGGSNYSYETADGGETWSKTPICPYMNRVFKVNDSLVFASGSKIWEYKSASPAPIPAPIPQQTFIACHPNPVNKDLTIDLSLSRWTRVVIGFYDELGRQVRVIENADKFYGIYHYTFDTGNLPGGVYFVILKTHSDRQTIKVLINHSR